MKATLAGFVAFLLLPQPLLAEAFRWVDGSGTVHYSDSPPPEGATARDVTTLEVYECDTLECAERESIRAEQARERVRRLEESFPPRASAQAPASRSGYAKTVVREVHVTPFFVPAFGHKRFDRFKHHRVIRHGGFRAGVTTGGPRGGASFRSGTGTGLHGSGNRGGGRSMSMPRF